MWRPVTRNVCIYTSCSVLISMAVFSYLTARLSISALSPDLSLYLVAYLSSMYRPSQLLSACLPVSLVRLSVCKSTCICWSVCSSVCLSVHVCLPVSLSFRLSIALLSVFLLCSFLSHPHFDKSPHLSCYLLSPIYPSTYVLMNSMPAHQLVCLHLYQFLFYLPAFLCAGCSAPHGRDLCMRKS
jgi:hypothetical protein